MSATACKAVCSALAMLVLACADTDPSATSGLARLGIAALQVSESAERTTVVGLDEGRREVARLELVHGPIVLGAEYEAQAGTTAAGRQLNVSIAGETFEWQTIGFTDTRHMPALNRRHFAAVAAFVGDPQVRPLLEVWHIGWEDEDVALALMPLAAGGSSGGADDYDECVYSGSNVTVYNPRGGSSVLMPIHQGNTASCNSTNTWQALVLNQATQDLVMQCCGSVANAGAYAEKTCAFHGTCAGGTNAGADCSGAAACPGSTCTHWISSCGDTGNASKCKPCFTPIPYTDHCAVGGSVRMHSGQQHGIPHGTPADAHRPDGTVVGGCRTFGNECLANGGDGDCFGDGWGEGAATECCSGACCNYQCCSGL